MFQRLFGKKSPVAQMSVEELSQALKQRSGLTLIDVRSPEEYAHDGHVAGSRLMPLPDLAQLAAALPRDQPIICMCRSGNRSQAACDVLAQLGFEQLTNVTGGMIAWQRAGLPVKRK
jgi:rhodanese-related sulfurtransferase